MRAFVVAVFAFLYLPIALVVLFSFNAGRNASEFTGFSLQWYGKALSNPFLVEALQNSLIIALTSAVLAAVFGTVAALGLARVGRADARRLRRAVRRGDRRSRRRHRHRDAGRAGRSCSPSSTRSLAALWPGDAAAAARRSAMARSSPRTACSRWRWWR